MKIASFFLIVATLLGSPVLYAGKLALIIDDLGNKKHLDSQAVALPAPLNLAFLPHTPFAKSLSEQAHQNGHAVMLHQPMANMSGAPLGAGGLTLNTPFNDYATILSENINSLMHVVGVNNHMGSLLTQNTQAMAQMMRILKDKKLFFIDSRTSANSVAQKVAQQNGIPSAHRHVFLDHINQMEFIRQQFTQALKQAKQNGFAILIAHPYANSLQYLQQQLPSLYLQGITLVRLDHYFAQQAQTKQPQLMEDHTIFLFGVMP